MRWCILSVISCPLSCKWQKRRGWPHMHLFPWKQWGVLRSSCWSWILESNPPDESLCCRAVCLRRKNQRDKWGKKNAFLRGTEQGFSKKDIELGFAHQLLYFPSVNSTANVKSVLQLHCVNMKRGTLLWYSYWTSNLNHINISCYSPLCLLNALMPDLTHISPFRSELKDCFNVGAGKGKRKGKSSPEREESISAPGNWSLIKAE